MKLTVWSGSPVKCFRSSGFWVATPTGQVFLWQTRIIMHPSVTRGAVEKPYSLCTEQRRDHNIPTGFHLTIGFEGDSDSEDY